MNLRIIVCKHKTEYRNKLTMKVCIQEYLNCDINIFCNLLSSFFTLHSSFFSLDKSWAFATAGASESKELSDIHKHQTSSNLVGGCTLVKDLVPLMIQETS